MHYYENNKDFLIYESITNNYIDVGHFEDQEPRRTGNNSPEEEVINSHPADESNSMEENLI